MPPSYRNASYWSVCPNITKIPSSPAAPTALSRRLAPGVIDPKLRFRGSPKARAAPISSAKARVSVPS